MRIGLLATGTELVTGDILNTNGQHIAHELTDNGYIVGMHIMASDEQVEIREALSYLLKEHKVVVITGGLGPTSDDRTRFALAEVIQQPLVQHEPSWNHIVERLTHFGLTISENNRQQTLFPGTATVIHNKNGTANGCKVIYDNHIIYMLPGPPNECLPMFSDFVLADIKQHIQQQHHFKRKWRLFSVSESEIAAKLEHVLLNTGVTTGYRIDYPYLEFKIIAPDSTGSEIWLEKLETMIKPYLLADSYEPASNLLRQKLATLAAPILIIDQATGGHLHAVISDRNNYQKIFYTQKTGLDESEFLAVIEVTGLLEHWLGLEQATKTGIAIVMRRDGHEQQVKLEIPYRPIRVVKYATELVANQILKWLF
jgi:nicotinamide-nucleotide amidase